MSSAVTKVKTTVKQTVKKITKNAQTKAKKQYEKKTHTEKVGKSRSPKRMTDGAKKEQKKALKKIKTTIQKTGSRLSTAGTAAASRQQSKKSHTEKVGESRSPKQMTKDAKKAQKKAAKEAGKGFKDSFKDTVRSVKSAGKTLVNATGINGKQKKEQAVDKIYGITRGIGTTIAHPIRSVKEIASAIREKAKEKGESYVGGYILGEVTQTVAAAGAAAAAGKGLKGAKAAKKTKPKKKNDLADVGSKGAKNTATTIDYSYKFDRELVNFNDGYEIRTTVDKELVLVQYSSDAPDASLCYWTTVDEANGLTTLDDYMDKLALSKDWGNRNTVKVARIPAGTEAKYAVGTAREQLLIADPRAGGGVQYLFNQFDTNWITEIRSFSN